MSKCKFKQKFIIFEGFSGKKHFHVVFAPFITFLFIFIFIVFQFWKASLEQTRWIHTIASFNRIVTCIFKVVCLVSFLENFQLCRRFFSRVFTDAFISFDFYTTHFFLFSGNLSNVQLHIANEKFVSLFKNSFAGYTQKKGSINCTMQKQYKLRNTNFTIPKMGNFPPKLDWIHNSSKIQRKFPQVTWLYGNSNLCGQIFISKAAKCVFWHLNTFAFC